MPKLIKIRDIVSPAFAEDLQRVMTTLEELSKPTGCCSCEDADELLMMLKASLQDVAANAKCEMVTRVLAQFGLIEHDRKAQVAMILDTHFGNEVWMADQINALTAKLAEIENHQRHARLVHMQAGGK